MGKSGLPRFIERGGEAVLRPPYKADDVDFFGFAIRASRPALDSMFDRYVNEPSGEFDYRAATDIVLVVFTRTNKLSSTDPLDAQAGETSEMEASLWVLGVDPESDDVGFFIPYILNDNPIAVATGREVFGYPKRLAAITMPELESDWTGIVATPTSEQLGQSVVRDAMAELAGQLEKLGASQTNHALSAHGTAGEAWSEARRTLEQAIEQVGVAASADALAVSAPGREDIVREYTKATEGLLHAQRNSASLRQRVARARADRDDLIAVADAAKSAFNSARASTLATDDVLNAASDARYRAKIAVRVARRYAKLLSREAKQARKDEVLARERFNLAKANAFLEIDAAAQLAHAQAAVTRFLVANAGLGRAEENDRKIGDAIDAKSALNKAQKEWLAQVQELAGKEGLPNVTSAPIGTKRHRHLPACAWEDGELGFLFRNSFGNHTNHDKSVLMSAFPVYDKTCADEDCSDEGTHPEWNHRPLISVVATPPKSPIPDVPASAAPASAPSLAAPASVAPAPAPAPAAPAPSPAAPASVAPTPAPAPAPAAPASIATDGARLVALTSDGRIANNTDQFAWTRGSSALEQVLRGILNTEGPIFVAEKTGEFARGRAVELRGFSFSREERGALSRLAEGIVENYDRTTVAFNLRGLIDDGGVRLIFLKQIRDAYERGAAALQQVIPAVLRFSGDQYTRGFKIAEAGAIGQGDDPNKVSDDDPTGLMVRFRNAPELFPIIRELGLRKENEVLFSFYLRFGFSIELANGEAG